MYIFKKSKIVADYEFLDHEFLQLIISYYWI